jgi:hypothetical protein
MMSYIVEQPRLKRVNGGSRSPSLPASPQCSPLRRSRELDTQAIRESSDTYVEIDDPQAKYTKFHDSGPPVSSVVLIAMILIGGFCGEMLGWRKGLIGAYREVPVWGFSEPAGGMGGPTILDTIYSVTSPASGTVDIPTFSFLSLPVTVHLFEDHVYYEPYHRHSASASADSARPEGIMLGSSVEDAILGSSRRRLRAETAPSPFYEGLRGVGTSLAMMARGSMAAVRGWVRKMSTPDLAATPRLRRATAGERQRMHSRLHFGLRLARTSREAISSIAGRVMDYITSTTAPTADRAPRLRKSVPREHRVLSGLITRAVSLVRNSWEAVVGMGDGIERLLAAGEPSTIRTPRLRGTVARSGRGGG